MRMEPRRPPRRVHKLAVFLAASLIAALALVPGTPAQGTDSLLTIDDGVVSARFTATPAAAVFAAIRTATGIEVVAPAGASTKKVVTLAVERQPLDAFLRRLFDALDLGDFVFGASAPGGAPNRVVVFAKDQDVPVAPAPATFTPDAGPPAAVSVLLDRGHADSISLGPGEEAVAVVHGPALGSAGAPECGGTSDANRVHSVLVVTATNTYVTDLVVCGSQGLGVGQTLRLTPGPPSEAASVYVRFTGIRR